MPPQDAALPDSVSRWKAEWIALLHERDRISCLQTGSRGPPFAQHIAGERSLSRWLPWNWFSLDGTGWCYDTDWDELRRCGEIKAPVDWNGRSMSSAWSSMGYDDDDVDHSALPLAQLLTVACTVFALAAYRAQRAWARQQLRQQMDADEQGIATTEAAEYTGTARRSVTVGSWLSSSQAPPWRWNWTALVTFLSGMLGLLGAVLFPLPQIVLDDVLNGDELLDEIVT